MLTRLSARRTSTLSSVRPPPSSSSSSPLLDELSLLRWSTSSSLPPRPSSSAPPPPPSPFSPPSTKTLNGLSNPFSSSSKSSSLPLLKLSRSRPPPIVSSKPPPPPTSSSSIPPSAAPPPPPPPRPTSIRNLPILQPSSTPLPTPPREILPVSKFNQLLELAKTQIPRHAPQAREKPQIPGMHDRRFRACLTTTGGVRLTTVDLQELGLRLAVMGRLKREFGVLERVEFGSNPSLFTFPPVPSSTFSFTILHPPSKPPTTLLKNSSEKGYLLTGSLPLPLASPQKGGPSLAQILHTAAHYPNNVLRDIHPYSTNHQKVLLSEERGEYALELDGHPTQLEHHHHHDNNNNNNNNDNDSIISSRQFLIEITPDHDWNPSYVLDPHATFQTRYEPPSSSSHQPQPDLEHAMISFETQLWSQGDLKSFNGFSDGLKEARTAMGKRLKGVLEEVDAREARRRLLRVGEMEEGGEKRLRGGPFGENPPVMGRMGRKTRTRREGGLSGERVEVRVDEVVEGESEQGLGLGRTSPFAEKEEREDVAPHLRGSPRFDDASVKLKPTSFFSPPPPGIPSFLTSSSSSSPPTPVQPQPQPQLTPSFLVPPHNNNDR